MANQLLGTTWVIDTASPTPIFPGSMKIDFIYAFVTGGAPGDLAVIQNAKGDEITRFKVEVAGQSQQQRFEQWVDGLLVPQIAASIALRIALL